MNSQSLGLRVSGTIFGLLALAQLMRLLIQPEVLVNGYQIPLWPSVLALVVLGGMSLWMWKLACIPAR
jgi:ABC-type lipoprotein release transport system permease subunit